MAGILTKVWLECGIIERVNFNGRLLFRRRMMLAWRIKIFQRIINLLKLDEKYFRSVVLSPEDDNHVRLYIHNLKNNVDAMCYIEDNAFSITGGPKIDLQDPEFFEKSIVLIRSTLKSRALDKKNELFKAIEELDVDISYLEKHK